MFVTSRQAHWMRDLPILEILSVLLLLRICAWYDYRQRLMLVNGYQSRMVCQQILNKVQNRSHLGGDDYVMGPLSFVCLEECPLS